MLFVKLDAVSYSTINESHDDNEAVKRSLIPPTRSSVPTQFLQS